MVNKTKPFPDDSEDVDLNWIYNVALEIASASKEFLGVFAGFESLDDMRAYSYYFFSEDELQFLGKMSQQLLRWVLEAKRKADETISAIQTIDSTLDRDLLLTVYLNYRSRAFRQEGIVPVLDQFNHSDQYGQLNTLENGKVSIYSKKAILAGEQVYISYGIKDLYSHAIHYNYYDPSGLHLVEFCKKTIQSIQNEQDERLLAHLQKLFKVKEFSSQGQRGFFVSDPSTLLIDKTPSQGLVSYLKESCRVRLAANASEADLMRAAAELFIFLIDRQLQINQIHLIEEVSVPKRLNRFYQVLKKEREMLLGNRAYITGGV